LASRVILETKERFHEKIFVAGFHGVGYVGFLTVQHLVKILGAKRIGFVVMDRVPPFVRTRENGIATPYELYTAGELVILLTNVPVPHESMKDFCEAVAKWVCNQGFKEAALVGGLDSKTKKNDEKVGLRVAATRRFLEHKRLEEPLLEEEYYIVGPLAYLLMFFEICNFPALAVLPYASVEYPDPRAATVAIEFFNRYYGLNVNVDELVRKAQELEEGLKQLESLGKKLEESSKRGLPGTYYI